jgi:hypothetical protein
MRTRIASITKPTLYAACEDFCCIFTEDMKSLYLLSLLLTGESQNAEKCVVAALDDCIAGDLVFKDQARSRARRSIINNAIRLLSPKPILGDQTCETPTASLVNRHVTLEVRAQMAVFLDLPAFNRFAFVLSAFEAYSDRECGLLLDCTRETLIRARTQALRELARPGHYENHHNCEV